MVSPSHRKEKLSRRALVESLLAEELKLLKTTNNPFHYISQLETGEADDFKYFRPTGGCPYDLTEASSGEIDSLPVYYTISPQGVTQFNSNSQITFTPLFRWKTEFLTYRRIQRIRFFKLYPVWKAFTLLKKRIANKKRRKCQSVLNTQSFLLDLFLSKPLLAIRAQSLKAFDWMLFKTDTTNVYSLAQFRDAQKEQRLSVRQALLDLCEEIKYETLEACTAALHEKLVINGFRDPESIAEDHDHKLHQHDNDMSGGYHVTHAENAAIRTECRWLAKFVFLSDQLLADSLVTLAKMRVEELLEQVNRREAPEGLSPKEKARFLAESRLFKLEVRINEENLLVFSPQLQDFQDVLRESIFQVIQIILRPKLLMKGDADAAVFLRPSESSRNEDESEVELDQFVKDDPQFDANVKAIAVGLEQAFAIAMEHVASLNKYLKVFVEALPTEEDFDKAKPHEYQGMLDKYNAQIQLFNEMPESGSVGILQIDSEQLKHDWLPIPRQRLALVQSKLPEKALMRGNKLKDEFDQRNEDIMKIPNTVPEFVAFKSHLQDYHDKEDFMEDDFEFVKGLYEVMSKNKINIPKLNSNQFNELQNSRKKIRTNVNLSDLSLDDQVDRFTRELKQDVPKLIKEIAGVRELLQDDRISSKTDDIDAVVDFVRSQDDALSEMEIRAKNFANYQDVLNMSVTEYEDLEEIRSDLDIKKELWYGLHEWTTKCAEWMKLPIGNIDKKSIEVEIKKYMKVANKVGRILMDNEVVDVLRVDIQDFGVSMPIIEHLGSPALKQRHWDQMKEVIGYDIQKDANFTLGKLIEQKITAFEEAIGEIATQAAQEQALVELLDKVKAMWAEAEIIVLPYKDFKDVFILGGLDEVITNLDESLVTINTINGSRYVGPIREEVADWNKNLVLFQDTVDEWIALQKKWMYLENIFSGGDIARQLPRESAMFQAVDKSWKDMMQMTYDNPDAITAGTYPGRKEMLVSCNKDLDRIEKKLEAYLETKRQAFPRFYFLSNDELLEILAESKNPFRVQPHLRKCFDNIVKLDLCDDKANTIKAMISGEGERVPLGPNLKAARKPVEKWLENLEENMRKNLRELIKQGVVDYETQPRPEWVLSHFSQIVMTVTQIAWAAGCEQALTDSSNVISAMKEWYQTILMQIEDLLGLIRGDLVKLDRKKLVALITTDVHSRDVVDDLIKKQCEGINDFKWQMQLRFYWDVDSDNCLIRQINAVMKYGYEYQGVASRLVITPLTDRIFTTITGALNIKLGASPAGPAGTGKTETVKDLAKAMGIQCIVFNCSDQIDYKMMGKLFSGLAQTGSWTCLDEFNRIQIEVLSVVAQQLQCVRLALQAMDPRKDVGRFEFEGKTICLRPTFCVCVTMNPGYAGRTELPDNLKVCFRPVACMIPDYGMIAEIMLFAEGFSDARNLSRKMTKLYKLSSEQLSQQDHYDFGLRAVKSVLVMAGGLKRTQPDLGEDEVLIRAMIDSNAPKFLSEDLPLFNAIVQDLFPTTEITKTENIELKTAILKAIEESGLQPVPQFVKKVMEMFDTTKIRFGSMLVGPTGGGKTKIYEILARAMTSLREQNHSNQIFQKIHTYVLNPKCITMGELFGEVNSLTQEWEDGLASSLFRTCIKDESQERHWIIFDGPVDALWIENMNTVLDDNMTLCLANGERIKLKPELRVLFEVADLAVASPATVSRCGMLYIPQETMNFAPYVRTYVLNQPHLDKLEDELKDNLIQLFDDHFADLVKFKKKNCKEPMATFEISLATSVCKLFTALWNQTTIADGGKREALVEKLFVFSVIWVVGGSCSEGREAFNEEVQTRFPNAKIPADGFDSFVDLETGNWTPWNSKVDDFQYDSTMPYTSLLVPTVDTFRYSFFMEKAFEVNYSTFFTGVSGTGKTSIIANLINKFESSGDVLPIVLNFSARSNAKRVQLTIESKLQKRTKTLFGGPGGKKVMIYVDDINMPAVEEYGAQPPIELLRQFQDHKGFYDRSKLFWKNIVDTTLVASAAPPSGGRSALTDRFMRHFLLLCLSKPSGEVMSRIFCSILGGYLKSNDKFSAELPGKVKPLVESTLQLFLNISAELLPTPLTSHYIFNLRDISKVFQGMLMAKPKEVPDAETLVRLWIHEMSRCFQDRLVNDDDRSWFSKNVTELVNKNLRFSWTHDDIFVDNEILWADFFQAGAKVYSQAPDPAKIVKVLEGYLEDYNAEFPGQMNLVFFQDAIRHLLRISRILRQPKGNAMLVGVGGSGRQSLTRLACYIAEYECFQIELKRGYDYFSFREDLKILMNSAGSEGKSTVFLLTDTQIIDERFLEDVNNILNSGEVPNLFESDELNAINDAMTNVLKEKNEPITPANCWLEFVSRVQDNLHIVLCMSPVGESLRVRCRMFPSLINCCTIDWFMKWPREALQSVSKRFLADLDLPEESIRENLAEMCVVVHRSVEEASVQFEAELRRKVYTTPSSYLDLIRLYLEKLGEKRKELGARRMILSSGLKKLRETNSVVADLQETLTKLQPELKVKAKETDELLKKVACDQAEADKFRAVVEKETQVVSKQAAETDAVAQDAKRDLDRALPALEAAQNALKELNKNHITEVKNMPQPPKGVVKVMDAVLILLQKKPNWETAKKTMAQSGFIASLKDFDKDNIPDKTIRKIKKDFMSDETFTPEVMSKISTAATTLCKWVRAMVIYSDVAGEVGPKREKLRVMQAQLAEVNAALQKKKDQLAEVNAKVADLKRQCDETMAQKQELEFQSDQTKARLMRAEKLTVGLADEQVRWAEQEVSLREQIDQLVGDVFLSSAVISYAGPFTGVYRKRLSDHWFEQLKEKEIPSSEDFSLIRTLGDPLEIRGWNSCGLPTDDVSVESGIISTRGLRWSLCIDPQNQAKTWIKNMETKNQLRITKLGDPNLLRVLEAGVRTGTPVLIEDINETLDPALDPVLLKQTFKQGGRVLIRLGDSDVDYDDNFRFFITTKLPNPHYLPEIAIKVTIINFTVTKAGLVDQLLGDVVKKERPEVEEQRLELIKNMAQDRQELKDIESKILRLLNESEGNILDDEELIETLDSSKVTSTLINKRVEEAVILEKQIDETRQQYRSVAVRGSIIYFIIADLALVDPMYQYSLAYFNDLFNRCIDQSEKSDDLETRLETLRNNITYWVYLNICRGLFEAHKLTFAFLIAANIALDEEEIDKREWLYFLRGAGMMSVESLPANPFEGSVTEKQWTEIYAMQEYKVFNGLLNSMKNNVDSWQKYMKEKEPENAKLPGQWSRQLSQFQKIMILKVLRAERVTFAISEFVAENLGDKFQGLPPTQLSDVYNDTTKLTPIIFVLSTGADPTGVLLRLSKDMKMEKKLSIISLGQGQGPKAAHLIKEAQRKGNWVCLQNCHLGKSWMPSLEKIVLNMVDNPDVVDENFRLWLTSMPCDYFPIPVLQMGVKVTNEPPKGLRANLMRSYAAIDNGNFETCTKLEVWKKLLFSLSFFHGIVQERRKFGPLGFNIRYEFNDSDLETSITILKMLLEEQAEIPWDALSYVIGQINYGGRVTDDWDRRCLMSILGNYYTPDVLDEDYIFSPSGTYKIPGIGPLDFYQQYISDLPKKDNPEVFGMHDNANITFLTLETNKLLDTVLSLQPRDTGGDAGQSPEEVVSELAQEILPQIPALLDQEEAGELTFRVNERGIMDSLGTVLSQEMERFNNLTVVLQSSLKELCRAIRGEVVMSSELDRVFSALLNNQVPEMWSKVAYPSLKPLGSWFEDYVKRINFMRDWLHNGPPKAFWMSGFYYPQGFMTGALQNFSRKYQTPIDQLNFKFAVLDVYDPANLESAPNDGVYIYGLFMDAARWDPETRSVEEPRFGELYSRMPILHFEPEQNHVVAPELYECPVYKTSVRAGTLSTTGQSTNFILAVELPTENDPDHWITLGVALLCQLDD